MACIQQSVCHFPYLCCFFLHALFTFPVFLTRWFLFLDKQAAVKPPRCQFFQLISYSCIKFSFFILITIYSVYFFFCFSLRAIAILVFISIRCAMCAWANISWWCILCIKTRKFLLLSLRAWDVIQETVSRSFLSMYLVRGWNFVFSWFP